MTASFEACSASMCSSSFISDEIKRFVLQSKVALRLSMAAVFSGSETALLPEWTAHIPEDIDDTQFNTLCWSCHNDIDAPYMKTHSSLVLDNDYGDWAVECRTCHNPHKQQFRSADHGDEAYILEGTVADVDATTLTASGVIENPDQYAGYVLVPNIAENKYNYKIFNSNYLCYWF